MFAPGLNSKCRQFSNELHESEFSHWGFIVCIMSLFVSLVDNKPLEPIKVLPVKVCETVQLKSKQLEDVSLLIQKLSWVLTRLVED